MDDVLTPDARPPGADEAWRGPLRHALRPRWRAIAISSGLVLAVAVALLAALPSPHSDAVRAIDPEPTVAQAASYPGFIARTPSPLPAGWTPNSARFSTAWVGAVLHLGYLAPDGGYVGIEQTNGANRKLFVDTMAAGAVDDDVVSVDGVPWVHLRSDRKVQDSLVWYGPTMVIVVTGTSSVANLERLAASLHVELTSS